MTHEPDSARLEAVTLDPLREEAQAPAWQALCDIAIDPNPFFSPSFLCPYLEAMHEKPVRLAVVRSRDTGDWLAAAPVGARRVGLVMPQNVTWATDYSPLGIPLVHPQAGQAAVRRFIETAARPGNALAIPYLPLSSQTAERLQEAVPGCSEVVSRHDRAGHDAGAAGAAQLEAAFSGKRRKEMRRLLRRLAEHGETRFESLTGAQSVEGFEAFLKLEASGWKGSTGTALLSRTPTADFSRRAIARFADRDGLRIDNLWAGDCLVASLVLIIDRGHAFAWKIAFDETFAKYSPGAQIALEALRLNLEMPGFVQADSLAIPGHSMIEPLWRGRLDMGTLLIGLGPLGGLKRRLCRADIDAGSKLREAARALRKRIKG